MAAGLQHKLQKLHPRYPNDENPDNPWQLRIQEDVTNPLETLPERPGAHALPHFQANRTLFVENAPFRPQGAVSGDHRNETAVTVISFLITYLSLLYV